MVRECYNSEMPVFYLYALMPPGNVSSGIETFRSILFQQYALPSARILPACIPVAISGSCPAPPKNNRQRFYVPGSFRLEKKPVREKRTLFLPLAERDSFEHLRNQVECPAVNAPHPPVPEIPPPYPGVFLAFITEPYGTETPDPAFPEREGNLFWKKSALRCFRIETAPSLRGNISEVVWEVLWEIPVITGT